MGELETKIDQKIKTYLNGLKQKREKGNINFQKFLDSSTEDRIREKVVSNQKQKKMFEQRIKVLENNGVINSFSREATGYSYPEVIKFGNESISLAGFILSSFLVLILGVTIAYVFNLINLNQFSFFFVGSTMFFYVLLLRIISLSVEEWIMKKQQSFVSLIRKSKTVIFILISVFVSSFISYFISITFFGWAPTLLESIGFIFGFPVALASLFKALQFLCVQLKKILRSGKAGPNS